MIVSRTKELTNADWEALAGSNLCAAMVINSVNVETRTIRDINDITTWCRENCQGVFHFVDISNMPTSKRRKIRFSSKSDLAMFLLRWSGNSK